MHRPSSGPLAVNAPRGNGLTFTLLQRFRELLSDGSLKPGSRLPPERDLARQFGVSRNSLRQALQVLGAMGVLTQRTGSGTFLRTDASGVFEEPFRFMMLLDSVSHEELFEARLIVEPELAYHAAQRATLEHIQILRQALENLRAAAGDRLRVAEADLMFHRGILRAAGNRVCETMFSVIYRSLLSSIMETSRLVDLEHTMRFHSRILRAIDARQPDAARKAMREHIADARSVRQLGAAARPAPLGRLAPVKPKGARDH